jgi:phage shock protein A
MKRVNSIIIMLIILFLLNQLYAQDIEKIYGQAKTALQAGDYNKALLRINEARTQIMVDPRLDPNDVYFNKLLPKLETVAQNMELVDQALEKLYTMIKDTLVFTDVLPSPEAVNYYLLQAKEISEKLLAKRDSVLTSNDFEPEYREALRYTFGYLKIDQFINEKIMEKLTVKFVQIAYVLTDSIRLVDDRYKNTLEELSKLKKVAGASKSKIQQLEKELAQLSEERLNYLSTISEMLMGESGPEKEKIQNSLVDKNVDVVFSNLIQAEIARIKGISEIDSTGYNQLYENYQRIKSYNSIFSRNKVIQDQSELLAQYEAAIKNVQVTGVGGKYNLGLYIALPVILLIFFIIIYKMSSSKRKKSPQATDADPLQVKGNREVKKPEV